MISKIFRGYTSGSPLTRGREEKGRSRGKEGEGKGKWQFHTFAFLELGKSANWRGELTWLDVCLTLK
jgi:hypothetical protein